MGKINDYATGTAGPTDKLLASDGGTGETKNLLVSDIGSNFANTDLTFTANRSHDTAGYSLSITTDGGIGAQSIFYMSPTIFEIGSSSGISFGGAIRTTYNNYNANHTITSVDNIIDCISGTFNLKLPSAIGIGGRQYIIKNSGAGTITLDPITAQTIDGSSSLSIATTRCYTVVSNGANWIIINTY